MKRRSSAEIRESVRKKSLLKGGPVLNSGLVETGHLRELDSIILKNKKSSVRETSGNLKKNPQYYEGSSKSDTTKKAEKQNNTESLKETEVIITRELLDGGTF